MEQDESVHESISKAVRRTLSSKPSVVDCLKLDLINYSALARMLSQELGIRNEQAIVSAIKRHKHELDSFDVDVQTRKLLANSTIELRPDVAVLSFPKNTNWKPLQDRLTIFHIIEGAAVTNLVVDERTLAHTPTAVLEGAVVRKGLAAITVRSVPAFSSMPGALVHLIWPLSANGINLEEALSCYVDKILILRLDDAQKAFSILNDVIARSRSELQK